MNISLEKSTPVNARLVVSISEADYKPQVDKNLKDYRKRANIKGFRPGMVPMQMVQKMFGKSILIDEINSVLGKAVPNYIKENNLSLVGDPMPLNEFENPIDWDTQTEFSFSYDLGLAGEFTVDFEKIPTISTYEIEATEKEVEETIENLKQNSGEQIHPDSVEDGDMLFGVFTQGEWTEKSAIPFKAIKDEAKATFIGATIGATLTFDLQATFVDEKSIELATGNKTGLTGEVTFTIEDITRNGVAELNQAFFDKVLGEGKVSSEEEFRKEILEIIKSNYKREAEYLLRIDSEKALLENIAIELPEDFLRKWLIQVNEGKFTPEQIDADFENVKKDIRLNLIKNEVATQNEIKVEYPEVLERTKEMIRGQFGMYAPADNSMDEMIERIANGYLTDKNKQDNFMKMFNEVYAAKVSDVIVSKVKTESKNITVDEFKQVVGA
ncbi:trigger factor [Arcicella rosea]|uniref:trigger factor n=1 Tax=Arcicella rosea TaxID=502909 RepID=UPI00345DB642|eukprot:GDKJ01060378.1.p1 GENE.GDKJ01060378.1~~GDKJ01060378.1.p1  ORF type:complete len:441 (-),score=107.92 GDKJ01060378.1:76-1398(-)